MLQLDSYFAASRNEERWPGPHSAHVGREGQGVPQAVQEVTTIP